MQPIIISPQPQGTITLELAESAQPNEPPKLTSTINASRKVINEVYYYYLNYTFVFIYISVNSIKCYYTF